MMAEATPHLTDQAARDRITGRDADGLARTLFVEAGAGSGKTTSLVDRIVALVVDDGIELQHVAAITFTEKAAAELRDRVREELEAASRAAAGTDHERRLRAALDQVDMAAISTLHAFAQRILTEHPLEAGLPPDIDVMDELTSELAFEERWRDFQRHLLDDPDAEETVLLAFSAGIRLDHLRDLALEFDRNWDQAADPTRVPWGVHEPIDLDLDDLAAVCRELLALGEHCTDPDDKLLGKIHEHVVPFLAACESAVDAPGRLGVLAAAPTFAWGQLGGKNSWPDKDEVHTLGKELRRLVPARRAQAGQQLVHRLASRARDFIVDLGRRRRADGRLEFHDLLLLARDLLRSEAGPEVRRSLSRRYQRLLLDEFQDTDPIQIDLAVLIAATDDDPDDEWQQVRTAEGRLFFVGDPKQSIYRFRRADIRLFLEARERFGVPEPVRLTTNFRTSPAILDWVNGVFGEIMRPVDGSQPEYVPLDAAAGRGDAPIGPGVALLGTAPHPSVASADDMREVEARDVVQAIVTARAERWQVSVKAHGGQPESWRDCRYGDITVLLPSRTSLPALERALERQGIPYRAETSSLVYATSEVRDLLLAVRALADVTDELALVATLRSPLYGCGDDDLVRFRVVYGGHFTIARDQPEGVPADDPVAVALAHLRALYLDASWLAPSRLLDRLCRERRLFELGWVSGRPRDLWRRLRFVIDHARAWEEAEAGTLREYVEWARFQASDAARVAESILPETDDDAVRIMTIHGSKGLEFPITILSGSSTRPGGHRAGVQVLWPREGEVAIKIGSQVTTERFEAMQPIDEQMGYDERVRLLYVACTRARDHLVVSVHRRERKKELALGESQLTNAELLTFGSAAAPAAGALDAVEVATDGTPSAAVVDVDHPSPEQWRTDRDAALVASSRHRTVGASGVADLLRAARDDGHEKDPLDLELPAWRKGRYGSAIGRAVHGVLQTIDLATGDGLEDAVAGQAAAEGVIGREDDVAALVRAALASPTVRAAAAATERWRETYVATQVGDRTLEGYLDLLYRDTDGSLVVVDYKTASSSSPSDLDRRTVGYRPQGAAYALAVEAATGESVGRVVFVYLTEDGPFERELTDLAEAVDEVRDAISSAAEPTRRAG